MMGLIAPNGGARIVPDRGPDAKGCVLTAAVSFVCFWALLVLALVLAGAIARGVTEVLVFGWELVG